MVSLEGSLSGHTEFEIEGLPCTYWSFWYLFVPFWPTITMTFFCLVSGCPTGIKYQTSLLVNYNCDSGTNQAVLIARAADILPTWLPQTFWVPSNIHDPLNDLYSVSSALGLPHLGNQKCSGSHIHSQHANFPSVRSLQELLDFFKIT